MHTTPLQQRTAPPSDAHTLCRDLFEYDGDSKRVKVTKLGFACAARSLGDLWQVSQEDWVDQMWGSYVCKALDAALVYVPAVDYAVTANPRTGKQDVLLIDQSTSEPREPLCHARVPSLCVSVTVATLPLLSNPPGSLLIRCAGGSSPYTVHNRTSFIHGAAPSEHAPPRHCLSSRLVPATAHAAFQPPSARLVVTRRTRVLQIACCQTRGCKTSCTRTCA